MFTNDATAGTVRWPVVRISCGGETRVTVCGDRWLPLTTHWVGNTVPCCGDGCELCEVLPLRGLFYLPVVCNSRPSILEMSAMSSSFFEQHCKLLHGGIQPGLVVLLSRASAKSSVRSEVVDKMDGVRCVPLIEFVGKVMVLYRLPGANPGERFEDYEERIRSMTRARSQRERRIFEDRFARRGLSRV